MIDQRSLQIAAIRRKYRPLIEKLAAGQPATIPAMSAFALSVLLNDIAANREELHALELPTCQKF